MLRNQYYLLQLLKLFYQESRSFEAFVPENKKGVNIRIAAPLSKDAANHIKNKNVGRSYDSGNKECTFRVVDGKDLLFMLMHDDDKVHPTYDVGVC